ncbi:MAG: DUF881 domain-containing protein [Bacillota bacterium]|nr:DUF881 domain-containing protein [Bacillota bacterium]
MTSLSGSEKSIKKSRLRQQFMMFVIMLLVGFIVMNHIQATRATTQNRNLVIIYREREEQLNRQIEQNRKLQQENEQLNARKAAAIESLLIDQGYEDLSSELQKVRLLAGFTEVHGPGIILTLNDKPDYDILKDSDASIVHDGDIRHALDLLRNAGAAALSVNDIRITHVSFIQCIGSTIRCNQERMLPPYVIKAIGDPEQLANAILEDNLFIMRQFQDIGLIVSVQIIDEVILPPFADSDDFDRYITLLEGN